MRLVNTSRLHCNHCGQVFWLQSLFQLVHNINNQLLQPCFTDSDSGYFGGHDDDNVTDRCVLLCSSFRFPTGLTQTTWSRCVKIFNYITLSNKPLRSQVTVFCFCVNNRHLIVVAPLLMFVGNVQVFWLQSLFQLVHNVRTPALDQGPEYSEQEEN